jgi:hypothetical protein
MRVRNESRITGIIAAAEYILEHDIPPQIANKMLIPYYKHKSGLMRYSVKHYAPFLELQLLKWAERHNVVMRWDTVVAKVKGDEDKYLKALQESGIYFEDYTSEDIRNKLTSRK